MANIFEFTSPEETRAIPREILERDSQEFARVMGDFERQKFWALVIGNARAAFWPVVFVAIMLSLAALVP